MSGLLSCPICTKPTCIFVFRIITLRHENGELIVLSLLDIFVFFTGSGRERDEPFSSMVGIETTLITKDKGIVELILEVHQWW